MNDDHEEEEKMEPRDDIHISELEEALAEAIAQEGDKAGDGIRLSEDLRVLLWRIEQLLLHGYSDEDACRLARDREVDVEQARKLVSHGCPPILAVRILV
jgi:hypothetical protein